MRKLAIQELSWEQFSKYGSFQSLTTPRGEKLGPAPVEFFRDLLHLNLGTGTTCISVTRVSPRGFVAEKFEYHSRTGEAFMPLDGDVYIHIAPASKSDLVPYDKIEAFRVPKGTMVMIHPGVWHGAPFAGGDHPVCVQVVLPERTYCHDCSIVLFPEEEKLLLDTE